MGIVVSDFETTITSNQYNINSLSEKMMDIVTSYTELSKSISSSDLNFLTNKLEKEIKSFDNIKLKVNSYQNVLQKVIASYITEEEELANNINQITP